MEHLRNPLTETYLQLKNLCLGNNFPYYYYDSSTPGFCATEAHDNLPFWSHTVVCRCLPGVLLPQPSMPYLSIFNTTLIEIFEFNKISPKCVFRVNVNVTFPTEKNLPCYPHVDHGFPHKNLLIYLNNSDGDTVEMETDSRCTPVEDNIIVFSGEHYCHPPTSGRRVVIVCTYV